MDRRELLIAAGAAGLGLLLPFRARRGPLSVPAAPEAKGEVGVRVDGGQTFWVAFGPVDDVMDVHVGGRRLEAGKDYEVLHEDGRSGIRCRGAEVVRTKSRLTIRRG